MSETPKPRHGETRPVPFRSGRFFNIGSQWYFACREGIDRGPFSTRQMAEQALSRHIENCNNVRRATGF
ncbi:DUF6316 family protein [Thiohalophilus thiocyanatoxydans]|uniref:DUF6316 domain-containing protein n=1 Tax=Thiohalophilus thiocyanatoxydans TaxID=381308 RepID=A0A4V3H3X5_9GAMM|nr:DUF6316 family protein [Thiohalophilus thiocyanatoxydans]TDY00945.1 hypothetical protein EDC23_1690 [Thiohalophilus thiocyanatoxydans]